MAQSFCGFSNLQLWVDEQIAKGALEKPQKD